MIVEIGIDPEIIRITKEAREIGTEIIGTSLNQIMKEAIIQKEKRRPLVKKEILIEITIEIVIGIEIEIEIKREIYHPKN